MPASLVPDIQVLLNRADMPPELYASLLSVDVKDDTEAPSACTLSFVAWSDATLDVSRVDSSLFEMETEIEVRLGYVTKLASVCKAEVVSVELEMSSGQAPRVTVRGYDARHRLRSGTRTRSFRNMKDSAIAEQIARDNGLSASVEDSSVELPSVLQTAMSDYDFLRERAAAIGFEVGVSGTELSFRPIAEAAGSPIVLDAEADLTDLGARVTTSDQIGVVEIRGWDPANKKAIIGRASRSSADRAVTNAKLMLFDRGVTTQQQADAAAKAAIDNRARRGMTMDGSCLGRADLRAGVEVDLRNAGDRFSGVYRLTSVSHRFSAKGGFVTSFSAERKLT